jgi:hypothetical protein
MLRTTALSALIALGLAAPALAQGYGPYGNPAGGAFLVDANDDGIVSPDEASRNWEAHFDLMDADGDGAISEDEFMDAAQPMGRGGRMAVERLFRNRGARFAEMDADGDKSVTRAEHMAAAEAAFAAADADGDGQVTVWEFRASNRPF